MKNKNTFKTRDTLFAVICMLFFITGMYTGSVLQQEHFIKAAVLIAEGLEGTNIEMNIDINETKMVDRVYENLKELGLYNNFTEIENEHK